MQQTELLHTILEKAGAVGHKSRLKSITTAVESVMAGANLDLTSMGRHMNKAIKPKSKIKEIDYLLSNGHLHRDVNQRMMQVLRERRLSLSSKKTRIGRIEAGFHFLGIHYPGTQTTDNTNVTQANDRSVIQVNSVHNLTSLGGGRQMSQLTFKRMRRIVSSRTQGRCGKHASKSSKWLLMGCLPAESYLTCIVGPCGG